jgi:hypothetical protein
MTINFPSTMQAYDVCQAIDQDEVRHAAAHVVGQPPLLHLPFDLKLGDRVWIDLQTDRVLEIERGGIVIWRRAWRN